jgi:phenylpyruvate tautomerase PptA (4-oxalocrotonate tautomerase family)
MTIVTVTSVKGRLDTGQRRQLAETLTDAVLVPEVGQFAPAARPGFQVHFRELDPDAMAIGGKLLADLPDGTDVMVVDIAVMDAAWPADVRGTVIRNVLQSMADACNQERPSRSWWANFRVIDEGSWGAASGVLSILDLLASGVFTPERAAEVREAIGKRN